MPETMPARREFREILGELGTPTPWGHGVFSGEIVDADGEEVLVIIWALMLGGEQGRKQNALALAEHVMLAVNTCAGYRAVPGGGWVPEEECSSCQEKPHG